ncbi:hydroxyacid dehydrogenase [Candidatus Atribacteria bacterium RBG_19FT_COMBO_35_14]|uniref:Hydroxyacid dehydrogenase n=1 Tax=Candidatus Sediminicultor quintus TaxID=1797291 RepID=A0A1F5A8E8_9BACT|nr:MAG: hydroxyacid dehydrogenase [Candidatus Atribacteria bacterium RBG_19FT_COMBO_35_14]
MKILITPRSFASFSDKPLKMLTERGYEIKRNNTGRPYKKEEMLKLIKDVDGIIIGIDELSAEIIEKANALKVISKYGIGLDNIDINMATNKKIVITNTPTANVDAVADLTFGFILSLARRIPEADRKTKSGKWEKITGKSVWEKTLGIIGLGKIGRQVVKRAQGFKMNILVYDLVKDEKFAQSYNIKYVNLEELLQRSDYITIHIPLNDATRGMISYEELEKIKESAFLINTSRGGIVDEEALYNALRNNKLRGAALDVYSNEPPVESSLKELDNVILTPHIAAYTEEAIDNMSIQAAQNLIDVLEGRKPKNGVQKERNVME